MGWSGGCVCSEVELLFELWIENDRGREGAAELAAEAFEGADFALFEESFDLVGRELAASHDFPNCEVTIGAGVGFEGFFEEGIFAAGARCGEVAEVLGGDFSGEGFGFLHDFGGKFADFLHELSTLELALLHVFEAELPLTRHLRGG